MPKKMLIDATHPEETRVVVVDGNRVEELDFETSDKRQIAGNIYLAKVTRVEPSLQAAFVDYGGNRHGFLAFSEIHPDYYQIPAADRQTLLEEERLQAERAAAQEEERHSRRYRQRERSEHANQKNIVLLSEAIENDDNTPQSNTNLPAPKAAGMDLIEPYEDFRSDDDGPTSSNLIFEDIGHEKRNAADFIDNANLQNANLQNNESTPVELVPDSSDANGKINDDTPLIRKSNIRKYRIQEVIKVRQIMLVQVVKEERGNKGAALTTYLSLAGRYCVLMPNTARGGGISRKITNLLDRKKLKEIAQEINAPEGAGIIIRTAGAKRTKAEIRRDCEYLMRLWEQVRELTLRSIAPCHIYEEGNLIKRSIRDLYSREIDEILIEGAEAYRVAKDFMKMIMPSHAKSVQPYSDTIPLFARYQVESYLSGLMDPVVQLKSGGYIVIGVTEALVAIDINSGRATKEGSIEETALKTNLEAAEEIARQLRLRDLAGLIVIDFIDMEDRRNIASVEKRLKDALKSDRSKIQTGQISSFGLLEMSRQRLHPGMLESITQPCPHCQGTGLIRSDGSMALSILRSLEEEGSRKRSREVLIKAPIGVINYLFNHKREHLAQIEQRCEMAIRLEADPTLLNPHYVLEKFKTATRIISVASTAISASADIMTEVENNITADASEVSKPATSEEDASSDAQGNKKKRRRRRRRKGQTAPEDSLETLKEDVSTGLDDADLEQSKTTPPATQVPASAKRPQPTRSPALKNDADITTAVVTEEASLPPLAESSTESLADNKRKTPRKPRAPRAPREAAPSRKKVAQKHDDTIEVPAETSLETQPKDVIFEGTPEVIKP